MIVANAVGTIGPVLHWIWTKTLLELRSSWYWLCTDFFGLHPRHDFYQLGWPQYDTCSQSGHIDEPDEMPLQYYKDRMLANGWCHHQVEHLSRNAAYSLRGFAYLANRQHSTRLLNHASCTNHLTCVAYNTISAAYETRHIESGCDCPSVPTPNATLIQIIRRGDVPLISIQESPDPNTAPKIRVSTRNRRSKYIAVSHVWADGLGNQFDNALPLCQINRLNLAVTALHNTFRYSRDNPIVSRQHL